MKYPLIFVHGIIAHDRAKYFSFWGRIPNILKEKGIPVYFGNTDSWGTYESNAKLLKENIEKVLIENKTEKVNLIAHSKGAIDSRFLIWNYNFGDKVASLTSLSSPHQGSELADLFFNKKYFHTKITRKALDIFGKLYGDLNPDFYSVINQLTTKTMKEFNESIKMDKNVYFQSLYTTMKNRFDDFMFYNSYCYLKKEAGENDGMVCEYSSNWGDNVRKIDGGISHAEILDYKKRDISGVDIRAVYLNIAEDLTQKGF